MSKEGTEITMLTVSQDRLHVTQERLRDNMITLGIEDISVVGGLAQIGSTLSILGARMAGPTVFLCFMS